MSFASLRYGASIERVRTRVRVYSSAGTILARDRFRLQSGASDNRAILDGAGGSAVRMGDHITQKFRALFVKANDTLEMDETESRASALVVSAAMVIERLPELADDQIRAIEGEVPHAAPGDEEAQVVALDRVMTNLREEIEYFEEPVKELDRLQRNAGSLLGGMDPPGGAVEAGAHARGGRVRAGPEDLWRIHRDELAIKRALVDELTCDALIADLEEVKAPPPSPT